MKHFLRGFGLLLLSGIVIGANAQMSYVRPTSFANGSSFEPCGGNNFVNNRTDMSPVYSQKTATPPVSSPQATMSVSGTSSADATTGNQTETSFSGFPAVSGTTAGMKLYYSMVTSNTNCAYMWVTGTHNNGSSLTPQLTAIPSSCYNNTANCNYPLPDDANISSLTVYICIQDQANNPTNPAQATIFDIWVGYAKTSCP